MSMQWNDQSPDEESWGDVLGAVAGCALVVILALAIVVMLS